METTSRDPREERRVGGDMVDATTQTGCLATGSLDTSGIGTSTAEVTEAPQEEGNTIYLIPEEDGISPDDAPEVALEDVEEEENVASMMGELGCPQTAADAIEAMRKRREGEALLGLGTLCVGSNEKDKIKGRGKDNARSKKQQKPKKKKKDRSLIEDGIRRMCAARSSAASACKQTTLQGAAIPADVPGSTTDEPSRLDTHQHQHSGLGALGALNYGASLTEPQPCASPPDVWSAPMKSSSTTGEHRPLPLFADGGNINGSTEDTTSQLEQSITPGPETGTKDGETALPAPVAADRTAKISTSGKRFDLFDKLKLQQYRNAPPVEWHSDEEEEPHTGAIGVDAPPSLLAQREVRQVGAKLATLPFGLRVDVSIDSYSRRPHYLDIEADRQEEVSIPMDEVEVEPSFGILSNTTFDPELAYHPHPYDHSINIQKDDLVGEDNNLVDLAMEDAGTEVEKGMASVTTTRSLQPFSWVPPSASSAFNAIFTGVSSTQTAALVDGSTRGMESPILDNHYAMDMTTSEGVRLQHAVAPRDIAWPFVHSETQPSPSVKLELFKEPAYFTPMLSPAPVSSISDSQATSHSTSTFPLESLPASRAGPVPVLPSTFRSIEEHECEVHGLNREVGPRPTIVASIQHKASPLRILGLHEVINLHTGTSQPSTPAPNDNDPLPISVCPSAVATADTDYSSPTSATLVECNENEVENKDGAKGGHSKGIHAMVDAVLAITQHGTEKLPPPTDPVVQDKPPPPIPPRIVGSKRKFVEDRSTYSNSINPARKKAKLPRSKKQKIEHEGYSTHKRLGEVKTMHY